jgi:hypothetical protein
MIDNELAATGRVISDEAHLQTVRVKNPNIFTKNRSEDIVISPKNGHCLSENGARNIHEEMHSAARKLGAF